MDPLQNNNRRFIFFYFNRSQPEKVRQVVPIHVQYWKTASLKGYTGGPFSDRTGGMTSFVASSPEEATAIIQQDPFFLGDWIGQK